MSLKRFFTARAHNSESYLVPTYSPDVAYSTRKINPNATNCIRVRRTSDDAEQNIGFTGDLMDTDALTSFVGANDGFVTTWYDQSGNANDCTQASLNRQPQIVASGTIITSNSLTGLDFNNTITNAGLEMGTRETVGSAFMIYNPNAFNSINYIIGDDTTLGGTNSGLIIGGTFAGVDGLSVLGSGGVLPSLGNAETSGSMQFASYAFDGADHYLAHEENSLTNVGTDDQLEVKMIGDRRNGFGTVDSIISELLIFNTDQTANLDAIRTAMNNYFGAF